MARVTATQLPNHMKAWQIFRFGGTEALQFNEHAKLPSIRRPDELIIKVCASSINPIDIRLREGYAGWLMKGIKTRKETWSMTLGRDFSGEVVDVGRSVRRLKIGDKIWGTCPPIGPGAHAEYTVAIQHEMALKPDSLSHIEAAALPHVSVTTYGALVGRAKLNVENTRRKRVLILGGSGGIGTLAIQLIKAWEGNVTTTCSGDAIELLKSLNADQVIDYQLPTAWEEVKKNGKYDVILDTVGGPNEEKALSLVKKDGTFVSIASPIIDMMDDKGVMTGALAGGNMYLKRALCQNWKRGNRYRWAFAAGNGVALENISSLIEKGKIKPVIQKIFPFDQARDAYEYLEAGHARGKTVISLVPE